MKNLILIAFALFTLDSFAQTEGFDFVGRTLVNKDSDHSFKLNCLERAQDKSCSEIQIVIISRYGQTQNFDATNTNIKIKNVRKLKRILSKKVKEETEFMLGHFTIFTYVAAVISEDPGILLFLPVTIPLDLILAPFISANYVVAKLSPVSKIKISNFLKSGFKAEEENDTKTVKISYKTSEALYSYLSNL